MRFECRLSGVLVEALVGAALSATLRRPAVTTFYVAVIGLLAICCGVTLPEHVLGAVVGGVCGIVATGASVGRLRHRFSTVIEARGYRAGATITTEWADEEFVVSTPISIVRYRLADFGHVRRRGAAVSAVQLATRQFLVLPAVLVPPSFGSETVGARRRRADAS